MILLFFKLNSLYSRVPDAKFGDIWTTTNGFCEKKTANVNSLQTDMRQTEKMFRKDRTFETSVQVS